MWLLLVLFAMPLLTFVYVYISIFIVLIYDKTVNLKGDYTNHCTTLLAYLWDIYGKIWHGYEVHGIENVSEGPGLIIYYHAALPVDYLLFLTRLFLLKKRKCRTVADRFVFKLPGYKKILEVLYIMAGTKEDCLSVLKDGHLIAIAPGGTREAQFSDHTYKTIWRNRIGFAKIAIEAKVPIIPMFTQNVREGYRTFGKIQVMQRLYESIRWPLLPVYGGFPVKWRTYLGKPIPYDPNITPEELAEKAKISLQTLIERHQKLPGSIGTALLERFYTNSKKD
ncbi:transmembrane protein 68-like [Hemicordylus capensis]|uniref:transmembrane protein 68-like n=1 Tax=Hemicordylus capensis TaxID=884348 RepID=UPI00230269A5|nr:transmembrane protein 68-like [Hemicordylus capensis]